MQLTHANTWHRKPQSSIRTLFEDDTFIHFRHAYFALLNMVKTTKLAVVQFCPELGRKNANFSCMRRLTDDIDADIIVFPELCTTGYFFLSREEVSDVAEPVAGETGSFFTEIAREHQAVVVAGFAEKDGDRVFNACLIVVPEEKRPRVYRKTHLFYREKQCFDQGDTGFFVVNDHRRDVRIGPMICYDWRFPETTRILTLLGADIIVCPSDLVTDIWRRVLPGRAIENKVYIAVANRIGAETRDDEKLLFTGRSAIYDFDGNEMHSAGPENESVLEVEISPELTRDKSFNSLNDILGDRQPQHYKLLI